MIFNLPSITLIGLLYHYIFLLAKGNTVKSCEFKNGGGNFRCFFFAEVTKKAAP